MGPTLRPVATRCQLSGSDFQTVGVATEKARAFKRAAVNVEVELVQARTHIHTYIHKNFIKMMTKCIKLTIRETNKINIKSV